MLKSRQLWLIYAIILIDLIVANGLGPLVTKYVEDLPAKAVFITGGTALALGIQLAIAPAMGNYSDKRGRRPALLLTTITTFFASLLLLPVQAWSFITNRVAEGTTNGMYSVIRSAVTDMTPKEELVKTTGIATFVLAAGGVLGPMATAFVILAIPEARDNPLPVVLFMLGMALLNIILAYLFKETQNEKSEVDKKELKNKAISALKVKTLWEQLNKVDEQLPGFKAIFILSLLGSLATGYYNYFVAFLTQSELKMEPLETSYFFIFYGVLALLANYVFFGFIVHRLNKRIALLVLAGLGVATQVSFAFSEHSKTLLYVVGGIDAVTITLIGGLVGGVLSKMVNEGEGQGELFGNVQALGGVASFSTAVVNSALSGVSSKAPFFWFAACMAALVVFCIRLPDEARKVTDQQEG